MLAEGDPSTPTQPDSPVGPLPADGLADRLRRGEAAAAEEVYAKYYHRLVRLVSSRQLSAFRARFDGEDVVQSTLRTFFIRVRSGQLSIDPSEDLWTLLALIALRKLAGQARKHRAGRRTVQQEAPLSTQDGTPVDVSSNGQEGPEMQCEIRDELQHILAQVPPQYRDIVMLRLEGQSVSEVAQHVGCCERTVFRALERCCEVAAERNEDNATL